MEKKLFIPIVALAALGMTNIASAARHGRDRDKDYNAMCAPEPGAPCYPDDAPCAMCLGPENTAVNPAVRPYTCNGDIDITVAGFYWNAHQDGMEYAIDNQVVNPVVDGAASFAAALASVQQLNNVIEAQYKNPDFKWEFGFKVGLAYNSACDGWDIGVLWTWYRGRASSHIESEPDDNRTLLPLWSNFSNVIGSVLYATDIETHWKLQLNLVDIELGREYWVSRYLTFRPHMGLRIAFIKQELGLEHKGGSWSALAVTGGPTQVALNNEVHIHDNFKGVGVRGGFDTVWNFGRGWGLYGNFAGAIVYGRFHIDHKEENRTALPPNTKTAILETEDSFRASRGMLDLALGVQYATMFCQCKYRFTAMLGWEHHLFFDQNQMWRVVRIGDVGSATQTLPNNSGNNVYHQRRGDLSTQGWTLTLKFEF